MSTGTRSKRVIRSHTKSRMGCTHCKKRRVKCDEARPTCGSCERRKTECVYEYNKRENSDIKSDCDAQSSTVTLRPEGTQQVMRKQPTPPPFSYLDMTSLKLFYHWTHFTSKTFSHTGFAQHALPQIAFCNPGLMHAILALSALHLHQLHGPQSRDDETDYLSLAISHRNHVPPLLSQITDPDVSVITLAILQVCNYADPSPNPSSRDIFSLVGSIYEAVHGKRLENPSITPFVAWKSSGSHHDSGIRNHIRVSFPTSLHRIHLPTTPSTISDGTSISIVPSDFVWPDPAEVSDPVTSSTYAHAAQTLMESWYLFQRPGCEMAAAFLWSVRFTEQFYNYLVVEKRPRALVLLYYFCFILSWLSDPGQGDVQEQQCWWAIGQTKFGESMGQVAYMLDERWRRCITTIAS
ncbi:hypothetical protein E1B28_003286 [Marasmius oreades]|uniref:Zn(2)-C6 fungal-type domain-containing protein n=1 Tax=Marasmius oreades TaxID=181124 RepID=A0A9P7UKD2_9AGAR|nr:uncharacterized protein E1B28_003286 [Marasmius oreades]KAG7085743.1 hypothetical protein E1B28_003286 [Marasmius oreades]